MSVVVVVVVVVDLDGDGYVEVDATFDATPAMVGPTSHRSSPSYDIVDVLPAAMPIVQIS